MADSIRIAMLQGKFRLLQIYFAATSFFANYCWRGEDEISKAASH